MNVADTVIFSAHQMETGGFPALRRVLDDEQPQVDPGTLAEVEADVLARLEAGRIVRCADAKGYGIPRESLAGIIHRLRQSGLKVSVAVHGSRAGFAKSWWVRPDALD